MWAICSAIFTQPNLGLRRFSAIMIAMSSADGPLGPGLRGRPEDENRLRYFRSINPLRNLNNVADFTIKENFGMRPGKTKSLISPST